MDILYAVVIGLLVVLELVYLLFNKKLKAYEGYIKYAIDFLVEKADEMYQYNADKHSYVAEKIYAILPKFLKVLIKEEMIDEWIHLAVIKLRSKQALSLEMTYRAISKIDSNITNEDLKKIADDVRKETKISVEPTINLENFKKSTIGIKFSKIF